jgi:hypothetical protein
LQALEWYVRGLCRGQEQSGSGFKVVKGVAEMKSCKTNQNGQAKMARIGLLTVIAGMVLNLSVGTALYAAESFKVWKLNAAGSAGELVQPISSDSLAEAKKWLTSEDDKDLASFVEKFSKEPTQFVEAIHQTMVGVDEETKMNALIGRLGKLKEQDATKFGGGVKKAVLLGRLEELKNLDTKLRKDLNSEAMLKVLFSDDLLKKLELTSTAPATSADSSKKDKDLSFTGFPFFGGDENGNSNEKEDRVAEVTDEQIQAAVQPVCDKQKELVEQSDKKLEDLQNLLNQVVNQFQAISQQPAAVAKREQAEDVIGPLLKQIAKDNQPAANAQPATPTAPQVASAAEDDSENPENPNSALNQLPQPQSPVGQFAAGPVPTTPETPSNRPPIVLDLPANRGARDLRAATGAIAQAEEVLAKGIPGSDPFSAMFGGLSSMVGAMGGFGANPALTLMQLGASKVETDGALASVNTAVKTTTDRLTQLDADLEQLNAGGRAALPSWVGEEEARLQQVYDRTKRKFDQEQENQLRAAKASGDPNAMSQVTANMAGISQELENAQTKLSGFKAEVQRRVEDANKEIGKLRGQRQNLDDALAELKRQKGKLDAQNKQLVQQATAAQQQQLALMNQATQAQAAANAGPNVNRILQSPARSGLGASFAGGGVSRGSLGAGATGAAPTSSVQTDLANGLLR